MSWHNFKQAVYLKELSSLSAYKIWSKTNQGEVFENPALSQIVLDKCGIFKNVTLFNAYITSYFTSTKIKIYLEIYFPINLQTTLLSAKLLLFYLQEIPLLLWAVPKAEGTVLFMS